MSAFVGYTGRLTLNGLHATLTVCVLMVDTLYWATVAPLRGQGFRLKNAVSQFVEFGAHSLPIVMLICFLIGAIMAMQSSYQLARFGAVHLVANLVGIAAMREFAPLMTAIIITGRSGSAITAEIGTMKVAEEIDALEVMGLNVTKFLVVPKFIGMLLAVPMVTLIAIATMIFGGFLTSAVVIGLDVSSYIAQTADALVFKDLVVGVTKSIFFAIVICWVGVYRGFQVYGGAEGVGKETTSSVVTSIFLIIVLDMVFTVFFYFV
jgi:phospholipid/cholesterol/gamma-HCH transport system permease protein